MPGIRTSAITYRRGISNNTPNFFLFAQANYVIPQPTNKFRQNNVISVSPPPAPTCDYTFIGTGPLTQTIVDAEIGTAQKICIVGYTSIDSNAFLNKSQITSVNIPTSVTSIGEAAFDLCTGLTTLTIPDSVTDIAPRAIRRCGNLESVTLPSNPLFTIINAGTFFSCPKLSSIIIPNSVITIDISAFQSCINLSSVTIGTSVQNINPGAFQGCLSLGSIVIPNSVTNILSQAFRGCTALTSIAIPTSVTTIGVNAFSSSGLNTVTIANGQLGIPSPATGVSFFGATVTTQLP